MLCMKKLQRVLLTFAVAATSVADPDNICPDCPDPKYVEIRGSGSLKLKIKNLKSKFYFRA